MDPNPQKPSIQFKDLGEPMQKLIRDLKGKDNVDLSLLEYVSVRDITTVLNAQSQNVEAEKIWAMLQLSERKPANAREVLPPAAAPSETAPIATQASASSCSFNSDPSAPHHVHVAGDVTPPTAAESAAISALADLTISGDLKGPQGTASVTVPAVHPELRQKLQSFRLNQTSLRLQESQAAHQSVIVVPDSSDAASASAGLTNTGVSTSVGVGMVVSVGEDLNCATEALRRRWMYFSSSEYFWKYFPAAELVPIEGAFLNNVPVVEITHASADKPIPWKVNLDRMIAYTPEGLPVPITWTTEEQLQRPEFPGPFVVWSARNPLTQQWEKFPARLCRIFELRKLAGHTSITVVDRSMPVEIRFDELKQVNVSNPSHYRTLRREVLFPVWQKFTYTCNPPTWESLTSFYSTIMDEYYAAGEPSFELSKEGDEGNGRFGVDFVGLRMFDGVMYHPIRRHLSAEMPVPTAMASSSTLSLSSSSPPSSLPLPSSTQSNSTQTTSTSTTTADVMMAETVKAVKPIAMPIYVPVAVPVADLVPVVAATSTSTPTLTPTLTTTSEPRSISSTSLQKPLLLKQYDVKLDQFQQVLGGQVQAIAEYPISAPGLTAIGREASTLRSSVPEATSTIELACPPAVGVSRAHGTLDVALVESSSSSSSSSLEIAYTDLNSRSGTFLYRQPQPQPQPQPQHQHHHYGGKFEPLPRKTRVVLPRGSFLALGETLVQVGDLPPP